jgi:three-Cys-motif partner protein
MPLLPPIQYVSDDGLETPEVRSWAEEKYRIVALYGTLFSTGMKNQWDIRVYIDLYAGAGHARIKGTEHIVQGSPLIALSVQDKFDKYIFCEKNAKKLDALKKRVNDQFPNVDVEFIPGDCNAKVSEILDKIPSHSKGKKVLSFCFTDPYNTGDIQFQTVEALGKKFMDFLIVLAVGMDATRNESLYTDLKNPQIDRFLGNNEWRVRWTKAQSKKIPFRHFLAQEYAMQMKTLKYLDVPLEKMKEVKSDDKNLSLYHLAFFSRHERGYRFWDDVLKYGSPQQSFKF